MRYLTVLYDAKCGFCRGCRAWLSRQTQSVPLRFIAQGSDEARRRFPNVVASDPLEELVVVADDGRVYRDARAVIMCLYALREYRGLAMRLARPGLEKYARRMYRLVAERRYSFSWWLGLDDRAMRERLERTPEPLRCVPVPAEARPDSLRLRDSVLET